VADVKDYPFIFNMGTDQFKTDRIKKARERLKAGSRDPIDIDLAYTSLPEDKQVDKFKIGDTPIESNPVSDASTLLKRPNLTDGVLSSNQPTYVDTYSDVKMARERIKAGSKSKEDIELASQFIPEYEDQPGHTNRGDAGQNTLQKLWGDITNPTTYYGSQNSKDYREARRVWDAWNEKTGLNIPESAAPKEEDYFQKGFDPKPNWNKFDSTTPNIKIPYLPKADSITPEEQIMNTFGLIPAGGFGGNKLAQSLSGTAMDEITKYLARGASKISVKELAKLPANELVDTVIKKLATDTVTSTKTKAIIKEAADTITDKLGTSTVSDTLQSATKPFSGVRLSTIPELKTRVAGQVRGGVQGKVINAPVINKVAKLVNPVALAEDKTTTLKAIGGMLDDQVTGAVNLQMAKPVAEWGKSGKLFKLDTQGISLSDIKQIKPLPNGGESMAFHDMVEYAPWYDFGTGKIGDARRNLITSIRETSENISKMLREEGILVDKKTKPGQIAALKGEDGWTFLHRVATQIKEENASALSQKITNVIKGENIPFPKVKGETDYAYVARFAKEVGTGNIKPSSKIESLLDDFGKLADVDLKKGRLDVKRKYQLTSEGLKSGTTYETNPLIELQKQIRMSYELVKKNRVSDAVIDLIKTTTPTESALEKMGMTADEFAKLSSMSESTKAVYNYIQRVIRGESLPGGAITTIRKNFPEIAKKLDDALKILPQQRKGLINKVEEIVLGALKITSKDASEIADNAKLISDIKLAFEKFGTKSKLSRTDIIDAVASMTKDKKVLYDSAKVALSDLSDTQKVMLKSIADELSASQKALGSKIKGIKDVIKTESDRMGSSGTTEYGKVPGVPGLGNRVIVPQDGKTGQQVADILRKSFGYMAESDFDNAVKAVNNVSSVLRSLKLGFDMSVAFIQQGLALGLDIANWVTLKPTNSWAKATGKATGALFSKNADSLQRLLVSERETVVDLIQRGGLIETNELTEGIEPLQKLFSYIPKGKTVDIGGFINKHVIGRSDAVFTAGRVSNAIYMYKAGKQAAINAGKLNEWARGVNALSGVISTKAMGIGKTQRTAENTFAFLAARYTRASAGIIYNIATNPGGYTSKQAAKALVALMTASTAIAYTINKVQGKDAPLNPFDPDWGKGEIGGYKYNLGGIMSEIRRLLAVIDSATYYGTGNHLSLSGKDDNTKTLDQLFLQQFKGKTSPTTGIAMDTYSMLTNKNAKNFDGEAITWYNMFTNWLTPAFTDTLIQDKNVPSAAASFTGINAQKIDKIYQLANDWQDSFKHYQSLPTVGTFRGDYLENRPDINARMFISGDINTVRTQSSLDKVMALINENELDFMEIKGIKATLAGWEKRRAAGMKVDYDTYTAKLIKALLNRKKK
jgi:hypothetical protein